MATDLNLPKMLETFKVAFEALAKDKSVQQLQQVITQNKQLVHDNERLESLNQGNLDNIAKLKVQAKDTEKAAEKSRAELQSCQKRITSLSESQEKAASQVTNLAKKLKENDGVVSDLQKKANQKQDRVTHLEQELTQEKKRLEAMTSSHKKLQSSLESTTQRLGETRASLESYSSLTSDVVSMGKDAM
jgi:chromosome segregation ATPase